MISIRLPKRLFEQLKAIAKHNGLGYQLLIRDAELEDRKAAGARSRAHRVRKAA